MGVLNLQEWQKIPIALTELCINTSLRCGQSFRWRKSDQGIWSMALHGRILYLHQDSENLYYHTPLASDTKKDTSLPLINHYLNLQPNLSQLYKSWSSADPVFARTAPKFTGIRILRQDAWEALVGFICSSNNNIIRISQMVDKLCRNYGPLIGEIEGETYYDLPTPQALIGDEVEGKLRELGFGYRAKYIAQTAKMVVDKGGTEWLDSLRNPESPILGVKEKSATEWKVEGRDGYRAAHQALMELQGVGPKVADCVCLMGLGWGEAVPVDTHVWQIAQRDYKFGKGKHSSLTKIMYDAVGNKFRTLWGKEAGWAHSVLFTADLRAFSERLVSKVEIKEEVLLPVKKEEEDVDDEGLQQVEITKKILTKRVKEEGEDGEEEKTITEISENIRRKKRIRR